MTPLSSCDFYSLQDGCLNSLEFSPNGQICKTLFSDTPRDAKLFIEKYGIVSKSLFACVEVNRGLIFNLGTMTKSLQTVFQDAACESSLILALTEPLFPPGMQAEPNSHTV